MALPVKKIYVDTAHKTADSVSNSSFRFELGESVTLPDNAVFYVDDVCLPHAWYTIEEDLNDRYYAVFTVSGVAQHELLQLTAGIYTGASLATELGTALNSMTGSAASRPNSFVTTYHAANHTITIQAGYADTTFRVLTSRDIATKLNGTWSGPSYDAARPLDINSGILKQTEGTSSTIPYGTAWRSEVISLQPIRSVYLYSPNLGSFHTMGPNGEASIIKAIPVTAGPSFMIFDQVTSSNDYLDCSRQTLRTLEFQLKDVNGNLVPLHGSHLSFSLVFDVLDTRS